jgi:hypothetical protein
LGFVHPTGEGHHTKHLHLVVRFRGLELGCVDLAFATFLTPGLWVLCFFRGGKTHHLGLGFRGLKLRFWVWIWCSGFWVLGSVLVEGAS